MKPFFVALLNFIAKKTVSRKYSKSKPLDQTTFVLPKAVHYVTQNVATLNLRKK